MRRFLTWLLILVATSPLASVRAQTAAERADALTEFRRFFKKFKTLEEQTEAIRTLEGMESPAACEELLSLLDHKSAEIGVVARNVLATFRDPASWSTPIASLEQEKNQSRRAAIIELLGRAGIRDAMPLVLRIANEDSKATTEVRFAVAKAVRACGFTDGVDPLLERLLGDSDALVRMGAAEAIGELRRKDLGEALVSRLGDAAWQVQLAVVQAIASIREPAAVPGLIELMEKGGRLEEDTAEALFRITGLDFGRDVTAWRENWDRLSRVPGWRIPTDEELEQRAASRKKYDALYGKGQTDTTSFGGIETSSERILFIIDVSGSMSDLVVEREKFDTGYANFQKLTIVKAEMARTIDALGANVFFNIAAFATDVKSWKPGLVPANVVNRASAKAWVGKLEAIGGAEAQELAGAGLVGSANLAAGKTNTHAALVYPFGIDPKDPNGEQKAQDKAMRNNVDTVFFLSDGRPSTGRHTDTARILDVVRRANERFRIVFHTLAIGEFDRNFMRTLAEESGGVFVDLGR
jgi:hypothetical protein